MDRPGEEASRLLREHEQLEPRDEDEQSRDDEEVPHPTQQRARRVGDGSPCYASSVGSAQDVTSRARTRGGNPIRGAGSDTLPASPAQKGGTTTAESTDFSTELEFALEVAQRGARVAMSHYMRDPETKRKPDGTWATEADWKTEAQIRLRIARAWPDHNVLGEEEGLTSAGGGEPRPDAPTWVVDPIDGTNNYIAGIPVWATLVALRVGGT
ncbi:MAG TPA: inositol monophosphatase family protein, partial [Actinomycetota bacterium]|nr:inositol monophosphatase family protein [Actinomycetota bacterium]